MPTIKRPLLTRKELLEEFGFADSTERKQRGEPGWIPFLLIGKRVHYRRTSIEQWLTEQESVASEARNV